MTNYELSKLDLRALTGTKTCKTCKEEMPIDGFSRNKDSPDGIRSNCKQCTRKSKKEWYERNKETAAKNGDKYRKIQREKINMIKNSMSCADCNSSYHPSLMEFDHIDPSNKIEPISHMISYKKPFHLILEEITKCELVCAMCHRVRTWNRVHPDDIITADKIERTF